MIKTFLYSYNNHSCLCRYIVLLCILCYYILLVIILAQNIELYAFSCIIWWNCLCKIVYSSYSLVILYTMVWWPLLDQCHSCSQNWTTPSSGRSSSQRLTNSSQTWVSWVQLAVKELMMAFRPRDCVEWRVPAPTVVMETAGKYSRQHCKYVLQHIIILI